MSAAPTPRPAPRPAFLPAVLALAILGISVSGPLARLADAPPLAIAVWRLALSLGIVAVPLLYTGSWREWRQLAARDVAVALGAGLFLALHFWSWIASLSLTSVAASVLLVNLHPVVIVLGSALWLRERPTRAQLLGLLLALVGAAIVAFAPAPAPQGVGALPGAHEPSVDEPAAHEPDAREPAAREAGPPTPTLPGNSTSFRTIGGPLAPPALREGSAERTTYCPKTCSTAGRGNLLALLGALTVGLYYLAGRSLRQRLSLWPYVGLVYGACFVALVLMAAATRTPLWPYAPRELGLFALIALGPMLAGHTGFNWALRYVPAYVISLALLAEPVGAALIAALLPSIAEQPSGGTLLGGAVVLVGLAVASRR